MCHGQLLSARLPRGRTDHRCDECGRVLPAGELSCVTTAVFEGSVHRTRVCERCAAALELYWADSGECLYGDLRDANREAARDFGWRAFLSRMRESIRARRQRLRPQEFGEVRP